MPSRIFAYIACLCLCAVPGIGSAQEADLSHLLVSGQEMYQDGRYDEAEAVFQQTVADFPKSYLAHYCLGMALYAQSQDKAAEKMFKKAARLDKKSPEGFIGQGLVLLRKPNRRLDARAMFKRAEKLAPDRADIQYHLGMTYVSRTKLGRTRDYGAYIDGHKYFEKTLEIDPNHPDAYFQLGRSYEYPLGQCAKAIPYFLQQIKSTPGHEEALSHLSRCFVAIGRFKDGLRMFNELAEIHGENLAPAYKSARFQLLAMDHQAEGLFKEALAVYETYIPLLDVKERALYRKLNLVGAEHEFQASREVSEDDFPEFRRRFWDMRDPDPTSRINERLVEHYRRITYARLMFSRSGFPWDRRGEIYVRYGDPDGRTGFVAAGTDGATSTPIKNTGVDVIRDRNRNPMNPFRTRLNVTPGLTSSPTSVAPFKTESWVYVEHNLELFFVDQRGTDKYDYPIEKLRGGINNFHPRRMAEALIKRVPDNYDYNYGGDPLDAAVDVVTFRDDDDRTLVEVAYSVPWLALGHAADGQGMKTQLASRFSLRDNDYRWIMAIEDTIGPIERPLKDIANTPQADSTYVSMMTFLTDAGPYQSALSIRDQVSRRIGLFKYPLTVADYRGDSLMISDIKLSTFIRPTIDGGPFVRHGLDITPHPSRLYRSAQPVHLYYEAYNLTPDTEGRSAYQTQLEIKPKKDKKGVASRILTGIGGLFTASENEQAVIYTFEDAVLDDTAYKYTSIETADFPEGIYTLTVRLTDPATGGQVVKSTDFMITKGDG
jgi:GWxTD domain-containing protein